MLVLYSASVFETKVRSVRVELNKQEIFKKLMSRAPNIYLDIDELTVITSH